MKIKANIKNRAQLKPVLGAIFLASFLWVFVALSNVYTDEIEFELIPVNIVDGKTLVLDLPEKVDVSVTGKGLDLLLLNLFWKSGLTFELDIKSINRYYNYSIKQDRYLTNLNLPRGFENLITLNRIISPDTIKVRLEDEISKNLTISSSNIELDIRDGYTSVGGMKFEPAFIEVTGAESIVSSFEKINTEHKEYNNRNKSFNETLKLDFSEMQVLRTNVSEVIMSVNIQKIGERIIENIPVTISGKPFSRSVEVLPTAINITVNGGVDFIKDLTADAFKAELIYDNTWRRDGEYIASLQLTVPHEIISYVVSPKNVKVIVK